jgi:hypothetical protein
MRLQKATHSALLIIDPYFGKESKPQAFGIFISHEENI